MCGLTTKIFLHVGHVTSTAWPIDYLAFILILKNSIDRKERIEHKTGTGDFLSLRSLRSLR
jgi:hypothetical protein